MNARHIVALLLCATPALANEASTVRMPLSQYEALKARAGDGTPNGAELEEKPEGQPAALVVEARISGVLTKKALTLEAKATVEGTQHAWYAVPLVPSDVALTDLTLTGSGTVMEDEGMRVLVFAGPGRQSVSFKLTTSGELSGGARAVALNVLPNTSRVLTLELQGRLDAEVDPSDLITLDKSGGRRTLKGYLPATAGEMSIRWSSATMREEEEEPTAETPRAKQPTSKEPARINVQASMLASVGERLLTVYTTLRYAIFHAPVSRFEWTVPAGAEVLGVQGRGVTDWACTGTGERTCFVELPFPVQRTYELSIQMEQPLPKDATRITIPAPTARGVQRQSGHVAVEVMGNAEVKPGDGTTAVREDVRELPPDLFAGQSTPILLAFKFLDGPLTATLDIQRRESVEMSPISVDDASFTTVWTTEGRTITEGTFHVRNRQRQFLALRLPEGAVIQSAFVQDAPVKPSTGEDGRIRVPLRSHGRGADAESFVVQVVYILDNQPLPGVGQVKALLPSLDAEIGALHHTLILPDHQKLWSFGGDLFVGNPRVVAAATTEGGHGGLFLRAAKNDIGNMMEDEMAEMAPMPAQMMQNAVPMAKSAQARGGKGKRMVITGSGGGAASRMMAGGALAGADGDFDSEPAVTPTIGNTGVLPVRIQIPQSGDRYTAHAFYIPPDKALSWNARAMARGLQNLLLALLMVLGVVLGLLLARQAPRFAQRAPLNREQLAALALAGLGLVLAVYFKRQVTVLPGFVVVGAIMGFTLQRLKTMRDTPDNATPAV